MPYTEVGTIPSRTTITNVSSRRDEDTASTGVPECQQRRPDALALMCRSPGTDRDELRSHRESLTFADCAKHLHDRSRHRVVLWASALFQRFCQGTQRLCDTGGIGFGLREWIVLDELSPQHRASVTDADRGDFVLLKERKDAIPNDRFTYPGEDGVGVVGLP